MQPRWIRRRAHPRRLSGGGYTYVRESWAIQRSETKQRMRRYRHPCPRCGAQIISVNMPNGGWAHFEGMKGASRIKHPCLHIGEGLSRRRDDKTPDLFECQRDWPMQRYRDLGGESGVVGSEFGPD